MEITVLGGLGHVGLPLSLQLAESGHEVTIIDPNKKRQEMFKNNKSEFVEEGIEESIKNNKDNIHLSESNEIEDTYVILATNNENMLDIIESTPEAHKKNWIIRQTVKPGEIREIYDKKYNVIYAPERLAQGKGLEEIKKIPQIIGYNGDALMAENAEAIFNWTECVFVTFEEAELSKLFCNYYRYGTFALANDMFMISKQMGADFNKIRDAIMYKYPRMEGFPKAGFTGGFCLPKDTRYLKDYSFLAEEVDQTNQEDFVQYIVATVQDYRTEGKSVGILGLSAKPNNDDTRSSVITEIIPRIKDMGIKTHDPFLSSDKIADVMECDVLFILVPHDLYKYLDYSGKEVIDSWGVVDNG